MSETRSKYAVQFSAHGSGWVPEKPEFIYTLEQAEAIRDEWKAQADTVGGLVAITQEYDPRTFRYFPTGEAALNKRDERQ